MQCPTNLFHINAIVHLCSENGKFSYGYASSPGKRSSMEDFHETRVDGVDGETVGLFGVFDGKIILTTNAAYVKRKIMTLRSLGVL